MITELNVRTESRAELHDITPEVQKVVREAGVQSGLCHLFVPHTTAGITVNENYDPSVRRDILHALASLVLGTWQGVFFAEFDGPRSRRVLLKISSDR